MTFVPAMWSVWGVLVMLLCALYVYRSSLTRDEADQIYLDDSFDHEKTAQAAIVQKVNKIQPLMRVSVGLVAVSSLVLVGYYIVDMVKQF
jgi:hypothetical protein